MKLMLWDVFRLNDKRLVQAFKTYGSFFGGQRATIREQQLSQIDLVGDPCFHPREMTECPFTVSPIEGRSDDRFALPSNDIFYCFGRKFTRAGKCLSKL